MSGSSAEARAGAMFSGLGELTRGERFPPSRSGGVSYESVPWRRGGWAIHGSAGGSSGGPGAKRKQ